MKFKTRFAPMLACFAFLLGATVAQAQELDVIQNTISNVNLASGELIFPAEAIRENNENGRTVVVRLSNLGSEIGQTVHVMTTVHSASGHPKGFFTTLIEIQVPQGQQQAVAIPLKDYVSSDDSVKVELVDPAAAQVQNFARNKSLAISLGAAARVDFGTLVRVGKLGSSQKRPDFVSLDEESEILLAQGPGCAMCSWCQEVAVLFCGEGNVKSFSCTCPDGPCDVECQDP